MDKVAADRFRVYYAEALEKRATKRSTAEDVKEMRTKSLASLIMQIGGTAAMAGGAIGVRKYTKISNILGALGGASFLASAIPEGQASGINEYLHKTQYGPNWRKLSKGKPGSFTARHAILSAFTPFGGPISNLRYANVVERELKNRKK